MPIPECSREIGRRRRSRPAESLFWYRGATLFRRAQLNLDTDGKPLGFRRE